MGYHLLLQSVSSLGLVVWVLTVSGALASGVLNLILLRKRTEVQQAQNETSHWRGTAGAFEKELVVVRERCDRLEIANADLSAQNVTLRNRTDLESLKAQTANIERLVMAQGKRSQERHDAGLKRHQATLENMQTVTRTIQEMHEKFVERDAENSRVVTAQFELIKSLQAQLNLRHAIGS